jgi:hypothetical protein
MSANHIVADAMDTGRVIASLQKIVNSEEAAPDIKKAAQRSMKSEIEKWAWLSQSKSPADVTIGHVNEKYKVDETLGDYSHNMSRLLDALELRVLVTSDDFSQDDFHPYMDEFKIGLPKKMAPGYRTPNVNTDDASYLARIKANDKLHNNITSVSTELSKHSVLNVEWEGLHDEPEQVGNYRFEPIADRFGLQEEGVSMQHCAYLYLRKCMSGDTSLISIKDDQGERVATLEVGQRPGSEDYPYYHDNKQCFGAKNSLISADLKESVAVYMQKLDCGLIQPNDIANSDFIERVFPREMTQFEICADLYEVPIMTDAVYYAAAYIDAFSPKGQGLLDALEPMGDYLKRSYFGQELMFFDEVANKAGVKLHQVVDVCIGQQNNEKIATVANALLSEQYLGAVSDAFVEKVGSAFARAEKNEESVTKNNAPKTP